MAEKLYKIEESLHHVMLRNNIVRETASKGNQVIVPKPTSVPQGKALRSHALDFHGRHRIHPPILKEKIVAKIP